MALTLKEAITATQTTVDVNGTDSVSNGDLYAIEDEQVFIETASAGSIQPGQTAWQRLGVRRGQLGTTEAAHNAGTAFTLVETPLGVSGEQTITRIDTTVLHNTVGLVTVGAVVGSEIAAGSIVYDSLLFTVTEFTNDTNRLFSTGVAPADDPENWQQLSSYTYNPLADVGEIKVSSQVDVDFPQPIYCGEAAVLIVHYAADNLGTLAAGEVDVSFLVLEPAS